jgi:hypothetical protein
MGPAYNSGTARASRAIACAHTASRPIVRSIWKLSCSSNGLHQEIPDRPVSLTPFDITDGTWSTDRVFNIVPTSVGMDRLTSSDTRSP